MPIPLSLLFFFFLACPPSSGENAQHRALMAVKSSLDPQGSLLSSWSAAIDADPCDGSFEGVACNEHLQVTNISLQGKGLSGEIPPSLGELKNLTALYLHFNSLHGEIPKQVSNLAQLTDLYLNVNSLSGCIPPEIGDLPNLQVMELCCNMLSGSIPTRLGSLKKLSVLSLQHNQLKGAIPASLGELGSLMRLDLSFNGFIGSIPTKLANIPRLKVLDLQNNTLSGRVPPELKSLGSGFLYKNNLGLCGSGFFILKICAASDNSSSQNKPEAMYGGGPNGFLANPASLNSKNPKCRKRDCSNNPSKTLRISAISGVILAVIASATIGLLTLSFYRRRKQKITSSPETRLVKSIGRTMTSSPLISLEYSNGCWDPMSKGRISKGVSHEDLENFVFNLEDIERATKYFSESNLAFKDSFSAMYKGILRDGSMVSIKCISKTSCNSDESEFLKALKTLVSLNHENLLRLRGFCCSKGRGECFLVYDFSSNGNNLAQHLDLNPVSHMILEWPARVSIITGIAKGIAYLHGQNKDETLGSGSGLRLIHQNLSAEKVIISERFHPFLSESGLHKLLADDIIFSTLKLCAAMGYLAPEYTTTGRFTEKSDVYAFGVIVLQILAGKTEIASQAIREGAEISRFEEFMDVNLKGKFSEKEAAALGKIAVVCTHESPSQRLAINEVIKELSKF